nr:S-phase kinase-associated protein 1-like [Aedes albopictus]
MLPRITAPVDGFIFDVPPQIYRCFKTIRTMLDDPSRANMIEKVFRVPNVGACSLWKVLRWTEYHMHDVPPKENEVPSMTICAWDRELLRVGKTMLIEMVLAADHLGTQGLVNVAGIVMIDMIKHQAPRIVQDSTAMDDDFIVEQQRKDLFYLYTEYYSDSDEADR